MLLFIFLLFLILIFIKFIIEKNPRRFGRSLFQKGA